MIHQYINNGYYIVLDVNSGSVHVVDPVVYDAIQAVSELVGELEDPRPLTEGEQEEVLSRLTPKYSISDIREALEDIQ